MTDIRRHLDRADVPAHLRQGYDGRKFCAQITESVSIPATAGLWDGGSKDEFFAIHLATGAASTMPAADPFDGRQRDKRITLPPGVAIVRHSIFQGKDSGLTFYVRPDDAAPLLGPPAPALDRSQRIVLEGCKGLKPAYRREEAARRQVSGSDYNAALESLKAAGLLNAAGAITTAGKNAL